MPTLTSIREVLHELLKDTFVASRPPEKVTTYGGPEDDYVKIVETFTQDDEGTMHVDRCVQYKAPIDYISVMVDIGKLDEEQE